MKKENYASDKEVTETVGMSIGLMFLGIIILVSVLFEVGLLAYAYYNADKVSCNLLWCEFTTERTNIESRVTSECYHNGIKVNCSYLDDYAKYKEE